MKPSVVWDAFKAVMRGKLINMNATFKKNRNKEMEQLQKELGELEKALKKRPGKKTLEK